MKPQYIELLKNGGIGIIPTDTIYGIVGSALNPDAVEKIYKLKKRATDKPFIILISSLSDLEKFGIHVTEKQREFLEDKWPNPLSVVLSCNEPQFKYFHRGTNSLAFRMPKDDDLLEMLKSTGPLVAPSANYEGGKSSQTIEDAKKYFGDNVSFYVDGGKIRSKPSTLVQLNNDGSWKVLRRGGFKI